MWDLESDAYVESRDPNPKHQGISIFNQQEPAETLRDLEIGHWCFPGVWCLGFGAWGFPSPVGVSQKRPTMSHA